MGLSVLHLDAFYPSAHLNKPRVNPPLHFSHCLCLFVILPDYLTLSQDVFNISLGRTPPSSNSQYLLRTSTSRPRNAQPGVY